jgi:hypothetical protein
VEQAVDYGMETNGDRFLLNVKCSPSAAKSPLTGVDGNHKEDLPSAEPAIPRP